MCPRRPPGVDDCYSSEGLCARDATCALLMLAVHECVTDMGYNNSTECREARERMREHVKSVHRGMPVNCSASRHQFNVGSF